MEESRRRKICRILLIFFLFLFLAVMTAVSFDLLHRYAEYGKEVSAVNMAQRIPETGRREQETESEREFSLKKLEPGRTIRVQILGDQYQTKYHETLTVAAGADLTVRCGREQQRIQAGENFRIRYAKNTSVRKAPENTSEEDSEEAPSAGKDTKPAGTLTAGQMLVIEAADKEHPLILPELKRGQENPSYEGKLYVYAAQEGLLAVNEVDLETYLQSVVSSEMPSSYPLQALCAQAICARTYAVSCMEEARAQNLPADLDDSVSYQVYNNYPGDVQSIRAVNMTKGLVMDRRDAFYYSTSCLTKGRTDLSTEEAFQRFLNIRPEEDAEYGSLWIRWSAEIPGNQILDKLKESFGCSWKQLRQVKVLKRNPDGQVQSVLFSDGREEVTAEGEYQIRSILGCDQAKIVLKDGSAAEALQLLPSAWFYIRENEAETSCEPQTGMAEEEERAAPTEEDGQDSGRPAGIKRLVICGGGYGHGLGMSQNGAAAMAEKGAGYEEILEHYYS